MRNNVLSLLKSARVTFTSSQLLVESVPGWQEKKDYPVKLMTDAERKLRIYSNVKNWTKESEHRQTKKNTIEILLLWSKLESNSSNAPFRAIGTNSH